MMQILEEEDSCRTTAMVLALAVEASLSRTTHQVASSPTTTTKVGNLIMHRRLGLICALAAFAALPAAAQAAATIDQPIAELRGLDKITARTQPLEVKVGETIQFGTLGITVAGATLAGLMDSDGAAIVVHANADDLMTDPSGNSGGRIACGVFQPA